MGSEILGRAKHPPIDPSQVQIDASPPSQPYDQVAILTSTGGAGFGPQGQMNVAINKLKSEAAELGANGIIIQGLSPSSTSGGTVFGPNGQFGTVGISQQAQASATAIYVHQ